MGIGSFTGAYIKQGFGLPQRGGKILFSSEVPEVVASLPTILVLKPLIAVLVISPPLLVLALVYFLVPDSQIWVKMIFGCAIPVYFSTLILFSGLR